MKQNNTFNRYLSLAKEFQNLLNRALTDKELKLLRFIVKKEKKNKIKKETWS